LPYKDPYDAYLRGVRRSIEKHEERRVYNQQYHKKNKERIRKQQHDTQQKWHEDHREYYNMRSRAQQYCLRHNLPMEKECELCPEDDKITIDLERHHPDYNYPEIFVTVCGQCHNAVKLYNRAHAYENK
jgi:hypothetical protein